MSIKSAASKTVKKTDAEWKEQLGEDHYYVLRKAGTERAFSSKLHVNKIKGVYHCYACDNPLFKSEKKYDSGTGWPSFFDVIDNGVKIKWDFKLILPRKEVICARCGSHLGHVFNDGPKPTGKRYCMNGLALKFKEKK